VDKKSTTHSSFEWNVDKKSTTHSSFEWNVDKMSTIPLKSWFLWESESGTPDGRLF